MFFILFLSPLPPGDPGEGPDCRFLQEIVGLGPIPARIRGAWGPDCRLDPSIDDARSDSVFWGAGGSTGGPENLTHPPQL